MRYYLISLLLCLLSFTVSAQYYEFKHLTEEDGLLNDRVYKVHQDTLSGLVYSVHPNGISRIYGKHAETLEIPEFKEDRLIYSFKNINNELFYQRYKINIDSYETINIPEDNISIQVTHTELDQDTLEIINFALHDGQGQYWTNRLNDDGSYSLYRIINDSAEKFDLPFTHKVYFEAFFDGDYQVNELASVIYDDKKGKIWLQSDQDQLAYIDYNNSNEVHLTKYKIPNFYKVLQEKDQIVVISYANPKNPNGLYLINTNQDSDSITFIATNDLAEVYKGAKDEILIVDEGNLYQLKGDKLELMLELNSIESIEKDELGNIYIWNEAEDYTSYFIKYNYKNLDTLYGNQDYHYGFFVSKDGIVWIYGEKGIKKLKPSSTYYTEYSFADDEDKKQYYYVGNNKHGINFYDVVPFFAHKPDGKAIEIQAELFQAFISESGQFFGHFLNLESDMKDLEETFYSIDINGNVKQLPKNGLDPYDYRLANDYYGQLYKDKFYLNSNMGVYEFVGNGFQKHPVPLQAKEGQKVELASGEAHFVLFNLVENHLDQKRRKIVGSVIYDLSSGKYKESNWGIDSLSVDHFYGGLNKNFIGKISNKNQLLNRYEGKSSIVEIPRSKLNDSLIKSTSEIYWLSEPIIDKANNYYFPTSFYGLLIFNPKTEEFIQLTKSDGLLGDEITRMFFNKDSSDIYLTFYQGLQAIPLKYLLKGEVNHSHSWLRNEGMNNMQNFQWVTDSLLHIHKERGYLTLNLAEKKIKKPKLIIQSVKLFNEDVNWGQYATKWHDAGLFTFPSEITLPYDQNHLTIEFQGVDHYSSNPIKYNYQLIGLDQVPIRTVYGLATYQNLPYGDYTFVVSASNDSGTSSQQLTLKIKVLKPYYLETWFIIICIIAFGMLLYLIYHARIRALKQREKVLSRMVKEKTIELEEEKNFALEQKAIIEEKNREITDSISYSKRLQDSILPPLQEINDAFPSSFVYFSPKDIVSGDFYWFEKKGDTIFIACADCTGHGVPGAMVSLVCANALNRCVNEFDITEPADILNTARKLIIRTFDKGDEDVKDGMDISICAIKGNELTFAGAYNPLWIFRKNGKKVPEGERINELEKNEDYKIIEVKADKQPVALFPDMIDFSQTSLKLEKGDIFYLFSDGFADQFGGESGKKLKAPNFRKLLLSYHSLDMKKQKEKLASAFEEWKGNQEQIDDVCVIGVRV